MADVTDAIVANNTQQIEGVEIPYGYELWQDGIYTRTDKAQEIQPDANLPLPHLFYKGRRRLTYRPLWISQLGETIDTHEPLVCLSYVTVDGHQRSLWLDRGQITDHSKLAALGASGLPVDSVGSKDLLLYLRAQEALNGLKLPIKRVGHRTGPFIIDTKIGWLIGDRWIGPGSLESDPRGNHRYSRAFRPHGDLDTWLAKWREIREEGWVTRFLVAATFAAPILRVVKCRTFILHHWGDSSHGKTATAMFALSAWGNPELLYSSLNRTVVSITEVFRHVTDLPVLFDEKQVATVESDQLIYAVCTGSGRERGSKDGGLRQDKPTWTTLARTTGEVPLVGTGDVGGQFNRVLQIHSVAFKDKKTAESIYPFIAENYGTAGPAFLEKLADTLNLYGMNALRGFYEELRQALANRIGQDGNHAAYAAAIALAQTMSEIWLLDIDATEAKERALDDATLALQETAPTKQLTYAERALSKLRDHWIANPGSYIDQMTSEGRERADRVMWRTVGIESEFGMILIPHEANEILEKAGYGPERVWRDFLNNGWLETDGSAGGLIRVSLRGGRSPEHPVYVVKREVFFTDIVAKNRASFRLISGGVSGLES